MAKCDICGKDMQYHEGFVLTTREVVASQKYWQYQLHRCNPMNVRKQFPSELRRALLVSQVTEYATDPSDWLVCPTCSPLFEFDAAQARESARLQKPRPTAGPADAQRATEVAMPIILQLCEDQPETVHCRKSPNEYWQCHNCGTVYKKDEKSSFVAEWAMLTGSAVLGGGVTCRI